MLEKGSYAYNEAKKCITAAKDLSKETGVTVDEAMCAIMCHALHSIDLSLTSLTVHMSDIVRIGIKTR